MTALDSSSGTHVTDDGARETALPALPLQRISRRSRSAALVGPAPLGDTTRTRWMAAFARSIVAADLVVAVLAAEGLDIPLSKIADTDGAAAAFLRGCRFSYGTVTALSAVALLLGLATRPRPEAGRTG